MALLNPIKKIKGFLNKLGIDIFRYRRDHSYIFIKKDFHYVPIIFGKRWRKTEDIRKEAEFYDLALKVIEAKTVSPHWYRLYYLYQCLRNVLENGMNVAEIGVYKGGGSYFIASVIKDVPGVKMFTIDTFQGHSKQDLPEREGDHFEGHFGDIDFERVANYLKPFSFVEVIKGRIQDVVNRLPDKFHFVHLDVDIYQPTLFSLNFFGRRMIKKGVIVVDDYGTSTCPGVKKAVDSYCQGKKIIKINLESGQCILIFS